MLLQSIIVTLSVTTLSQFQDLASEGANERNATDCICRKRKFSFTFHSLSFYIPIAYYIPDTVSGITDTSVNKKATPFCFVLLCRRKWKEVKIKR